MITTAQLKKTEVESAITKAFSELERQAATSEEYARILDQITKLHDMKEIEKPSRVSPDTWALIGANLVGIVLIIGHEHAHVITTKAFGLLLKPR